MSCRIEWGCTIFSSGPFWNNSEYQKISQGCSSCFLLLSTRSNTKRTRASVVENPVGPRWLQIFHGILCNLNLKCLNDPSGMKPPMKDSTIERANKRDLPGHSSLWGDRPSVHGEDERAGHRVWGKSDVRRRSERLDLHCGIDKYLFCRFLDKIYYCWQKLSMLISGSNIVMSPPWLSKK